MVKKEQILLRTPAPYEDESLAGYILRLADSNYYESPNWILQLARLKAHKGICVYKQPPEASCLSKLIRVKDEQLFLMASLPYETVNSPKIRRYTIYKNGIKICPQCLQESAYCRKIWDWDIFKACPKHQCLLIQKCPSCQKNIKWSRPAVQTCKCGFDFRTTVPEPAESYQVSQSLYLCKLNNDCAYYEIPTSV